MVIDGFGKFFVELESMGKLSEFNEMLSHWRNMVTGLQGGCGCDRNKRVQNVEQMYKNMCDILSDGDKQEIKEKLQVDKVELSHDEQIFCSF